MKICEETLLFCNYKYFENEHPQHCDRFYQKKLDEYKHINCYYYDKFKDNGALDYDFEFELVEEVEDKYWRKNYIYSINKNMKLEEVERILLGE